MCIFVKKDGKEGVKFDDGTFISFDDLDFANLTKDQRRQLEEMHLYNELAIRKRLHEHGNALQRHEHILNSIEDKLDDLINGLNDGSLFHKYFDEWLNTHSRRVKALMIILSFLSGIGYLIYKLRG